MQDTTTPAFEIRQPTFFNGLKYPPHCITKLRNLLCGNLSCKYGFAIDRSRCPTCECAEPHIEPCSFPCPVPHTGYLSLDNRLCKCIRNCTTKAVKFGAKCHLVCQDGYETDKNGCQICECKGSLRNSTHKSNLYNNIGTNF